MLRALGLGATAAILPSLRPRGAHADPPVIPTRILFVYGMGSIRAFWSPGPAAGAAAPTETAFTLGELHQPLVPHQSELIFLDGIDMVSAGVDPTAGANAHVAGGTHALTAIDRMTPALGGGVSIDQYIAQQINAPTPVTRFPSVELAIGGGGDLEGGPTYQAAGQVINPDQSAANEYMRLFSADTLGNEAAAKQAAATALAQQKSVLEYVGGEFAAADKRIGAADRKKLDAHASAVRDLEMRLGLGVSASCQAPDSSFTDLLAQYQQTGTMTAAMQAQRVTTNTDLMTRLVTAAFSCDLVRVATLHLPTHYDLEPVIGYAGGMWGTSDSHDLTHKTNNAQAPLWNTPDAMAMIKKVHVAQAQIFAGVLDSLKGIAEPDGKTLLDHTIVVWCGQIAEGGHDLHHLPWVLAGGAAAGFKTGRYLLFDRGKDDTGPPHNNLFVSLANAMGIKTQTFGNPSVCTGPLAEL